MKKVDLSDNEWRQRLTPEQYRILRKEGIERCSISRYWVFGIRHRLWSCREIFWVLPQDVK